jgi:hypothetical protein
MKPQLQITLVNASVLAGLVIEYMRGTPPIILAVVGIVLLVLVDVIFWRRFAKKTE